uniref:Vomeronasal type-1 receptor n=1 Tax=Spermophilus dauricus TaxID=99837 RepID=A0A8C9QBB6_SPEDA
MSIFPTSVYTEIGMGVLTNIVLLLVHISLHITRHRPKPTDLALGFIDSDIYTPQGERWGHVKCKWFIYLYRLMRGLSISATCLLSVLQAITLSPCLAKFKPKSPQDSLRSLMFLWVFYMSFSAHFSISAVDNSTVTSQGLIFLSDSCTILPMSYFLRHLFTILGALRDFFLIGLIALSSGYMVTLLHRHKRQCQHLHGTSLSPKASREQMSTRAILVLMGFFVLMYCLDCIISSSRTMWNNDPVCCSVQIMVSNDYATISPLVFICMARQSVVNITFFF